MLLNKKFKIITSLFMILLLGLGTGLFMKNTSAKQKTLPPAKGYVALIIDDFGNHGEGYKAMLNLGIPLTVAVMPFLPYSKSEAEEAHRAGLEVIAHLAMEPERGRPEWLGPKGITSNLSDDEIKGRILEGLEELKWAVGMNNHMGSKATKDKRIMEVVLKVAKENNLYFLDSRTTSQSVAAMTANSIGTTCLENNIFLEVNKNQAAIEKQLAKLGDIALRKGYSIGIGHVGPEGGTVTIQAIKAMQPILEEQGIRFVFVSDLFKVHSEQAKS